MSIVTNLDLLRRVPLFARLTVPQTEALGGAVSKRRFKRGEPLVLQGQKSDALYLLLTGRARVSAADSRGREVILATLMPGDYLGEMSLIDNEPHSASVHALVQTDVLELGRAEFVRCLAENASMSLVVMRGLVKRLRHADRKIESLALLDVYGRVAHALLDLAEPDADGRALIREKVSRQEMAKTIGASREMVSRVMKDLETRGFIETLPSGATLLMTRLQSLS